MPIRVHLWLIEWMRILAGQFKGRTLHSVEGRGTRPTDARAREMLFNILGPSVIGARVLDLYGGTGSVGLEALSRGADSCVFIEQNAGACRVIKKNLETLRLTHHAQVWHTSVKSGLRSLREGDRRFDLIFADPPFDNPRELGDLCKALDISGALLHNVTRRQPDALGQPDASFVAARASDASNSSSPEEEGPSQEPSSAGEAIFFASASAEDMSSGDEKPGWDGGLLVIQHHRKSTPVLQPPYSLWRERRAGESTLSFFFQEEARDEAAS
jgi:16S rRNA (guanine966-N2)-methyltransferase